MQVGVVSDQSKRVKKMREKAQSVLKLGGINFVGDSIWKPNADGTCVQNSTDADPERC